jgi:3-oxoacyl-[acyl-carrier protein] reductase
MKTKKIAMVTGAAGTMGKAVTRMFIEDRIEVIMIDIKQEELKQLAGELDGDVHYYALDISDPEQVKSSIDRVRREVGTIDILVNNAGILSNNKIMQTTPEEWNKVLAVNLSGAFYLSKAVLPDMRSQKWGRIINTSSYAAKSGGITSGTAYAVSKGGMITLTFSLAAETLKDGITVNGIAPAWVKTPMVTEMLSEEERQKVLNTIPVGRYCEPEEFAHVVRFLASEKSGFITGEIIDLNGGIHFD